MKHTSNTEVIIIAATAVFIIVIASFFFFRNDKSALIPKQVKSQPDLGQTEDQTTLAGSLPDSSVLEEEYRLRVSEILKVYSPDSLNYESAATAYEKVLEELLDLKAPRSYQSVHLALVLSFEKMKDLMSKTVAGDQTAKLGLEQVRSELNVLFENNPWLRG